MPEELPDSGALTKPRQVPAPQLHGSFFSLLNLQQGAAQRNVWVAATENIAWNSSFAAKSAEHDPMNPHLMRALECACHCQVGRCN